jgi:hypothetical protein
VNINYFCGHLFKIEDLSKGRDNLFDIREEGELIRKAVKLGI